MAIRNSAKAVIFKDGKVLLTKNLDNEGAFYLFPGGGQEMGENLQDAVIRECIEEVGQQVEVGDLLFLREYIGRNHEYAEEDAHVHQVEFYFTCNLVNEFDAKIIPNHPDSHQIGIEWVPIEELLQYRIYPKEIKKFIINHYHGERSPVYLGDIN
ncbi:NUDIX domain-containing protein [Ureibacillus acetophenoni]|uniref:ADP-ribose pyrophosphatase YjhB (NUDIX family) n=1 Tax=Ureibacillus acetophenoni TaxID=614649 RepID=A0A285UCY5_9BACL|nr:NUDIX domain-containing protein [Ureibacillus acetophenoni]SOC39784.1 ADP-ribose pyrophosphatase YjhB (NUDIX family) [Ureibacillus acetophenoni]